MTLMITTKTEKEIEILAEGGKILGRILGALAERAVPGAKTSELDAFAKEQIEAAGGAPAFLGYGDHKNPYPHTVCISINEEVVHGTSSSGKILKEGDVVGFDIGMKYPSYAKASEDRPVKDGRRPMFTDMAMSVGVGKIQKEDKKLIKVTRESLFKGLKEIKPGNSVADIGKAIQAYVEKNGFNVVRDLVGHGVGYAVHEDPSVPNYFEARNKSIKLQEGMVLAIEPMVVAGDWRVCERSDGWTIATCDHSNSAHFEVTVAVTKKGYQILTPLP